MRAALLSLTVCLLVLPVHAKYSGGSGTAADPYGIATAADLIALGETPEDYDKHFILTADIDLDPKLPGRKVFDRAVISPDTEAAKLGFQGVPFTGVLDGKGHAISNLTIKGRGYLGLFGQLGKWNAPLAEVRNLAVVSVDIAGSGDCVGTLVGMGDYDSATSCSSSGTVAGAACVGGLVGWNGGSITWCSNSGLVSASWDVGGLVGQSRGDVTDCHSIGAVRGEGDVGGLVGFNYGGAVARCYGGGTVSGTGDSGNGIGGLVGQNWGFVTRCYSTGAARGGAKVGGLVGGNGGEVTDCYSMDNVAGGSSIGGLVGVNWAYGRGGDPGGPPVILPGLVARCYSTGQVTGAEDHGGLVGSNKYADEHETIEGAVNDGCWDTQTSGQSTSGGGTGKTTAEMQTASTFLEAGWDFVGETANGSEDIWKIAEGLGYPRLAWEKYSGGTGEPNDPYQIATAADLIALGETPADYDKHFLLTADIDLDPKLPGRKVFDKAVIAPDITDDIQYYFQGIPFAGVFDGNGHTISHLTINGKDYLGLFGRLGSRGVRNLAVVGVNVRGRAKVGGLAGVNDGFLTRCRSTGAVSGKVAVGGLVGSNAGTVTQCYTTSVVSESWYVGGLVGENYGTVTQCYSTGAVSGYDDVGGLVGRNSGNVAHCYSTGAVSGNTDVGGLVGYHETRQDRVSGLVTDSFWNTQTSRHATSAAGAGKTTAEMQTANTFLEAGWDFVGESRNGTSEIWQMPPGGGYPILATFSEYTPPQLQGSGTAQDPYLISNAMELGAIVYYSPCAHYRLAASVDLSGICWWAPAVIPWFGGTFDGNGLTISHVTIRGDGSRGLFGRLASGAEVRDLGVTDVNIAGSGSVGGLVGINGGTLTRCYSTGMVSGIGGAVGGLAGENYGTVTDCHSTGGVTGDNGVGGLVGYNEGTLTQCYSTGMVRGSGWDVGGLAGDSIGLVTQCYSTGAVSGNQCIGGLVGRNGDIGILCNEGCNSVIRCFSTGTASGTSDVGGLVGLNEGIVIQAYSSAVVTSTGDHVGGLVGWNWREVTQCYSTGAVSGAKYVGGLVGDNGGDVAQCYSTGAGSGTSEVGGLVGSGNKDRVISSFWDIQTAGQAASDGGTGKTTAEMQTAKTFLDAGWDFIGETKNGTEDIWWILEGKDYPRLWWELTPEK